jgi:hypothetical protein
MEQDYMKGNVERVMQTRTDERSVPYAPDSMEKECQMLSDTLDRLENRLTPVIRLAPVNPSDSDMPTPTDASLSPLAERLINFNRRMYAMRGRLNSMIEGIDV